MRREYIFPVIFGLAFVAIVVMLVVGFTINHQTTALCHRHGYPKLVSGYCVRIEHGTEVMVSVESLR